MSTPEKKEIHPRTQEKVDPFAAIREKAREAMMPSHLAGMTHSPMTEAEKLPAPERSDWSQRARVRDLAQEQKDRPQGIHTGAKDFLDARTAARRDSENSGPGRTNDRTHDRER